MSKTLLETGTHTELVEIKGEDTGNTDLKGYFERRENGWVLHLSRNENVRLLVLSDKFELNDNESGHYEIQVDLMDVLGIHTLMLSINDLDSDNPTIEVIENKPQEN